MEADHYFRISIDENHSVQHTYFENLYILPCILGIEVI